MALHEAMLARGPRVAVRGVAGSAGDDERRTGARRITTHGCPAATSSSVRDDALRAHATQVDPDGFWFRVPLEIQRQVWPTEDFELARSLVDTDDARGRPVRGHPRERHR